MIKRTMLTKGPLTSHNYLKITTQKMLLKMFLMSTYIMAQLRCRSRRVWMPKGMAPQPPRVNIPN
jgi:hypothetical protein